MGILLYSRRRNARPRSFALFALLPFLPVCGAASRSEGQTFVQVSSPDINAHVAFSTGASWVDYDGDGDLDLFVVTAFSANRDNVLYRNDGGDSFVRVTDNPVGQDAAQTVCSSWADFDNDGTLDAFVSGLDTDHGILYRGLGGGAMTIDAASGIGAPSLKGTGCAWGDYDNDGNLDLVLAVLDGQLGMSGGNRLFHNNGDGTFSEVVSGPVVTTPDTHHHPTWADYDNDGDLDLFFATGAVGSAVTDRLYRNLRAETGSPAFEPITTGILATDPRDSQTLSWADYDNDGDLDCYAINYTTVPNQLYRNDGAGFTKITTGAIVTDLGRAHGVAWGDFDNDADLDVYVVRDLQQPNRYYRNDGDGTFTSITTGPHVTQLRSNYGVAAGDYDRDGDLDLFVPTARSEGPSVLFRNDLANGDHWIEVHCRGVSANRSAIGAKVRVRAAVAGSPRWQMREISAGTGYGSQGGLDPHFGLADATVVDTLIVEWPGGGVDVRTDLPVDTLLTVIQGPVPSGLGEESRDGNDGPGSAERSLSLMIAPNPFSDRAALSFRLDHSGPIRIGIYDAAGREVATPGSGFFAAGTHALELDGERLARGSYWIRLSTPEGVFERRLIHVP